MHVAVNASTHSRIRLFICAVHSALTSFPAPFHCVSDTLDVLAAVVFVEITCFLWSLLAFMQSNIGLG